MTQPEFDPEAHEREVAQRFEQLSRYEAFDKLVDMALDGEITLDQAKWEWECTEAEAA